MLFQNTEMDCRYELSTFFNYYNLNIFWCLITYYEVQVK